MAQSDHEGVVIYGSWLSSLTARVKIALKLKGIDYEYVEEDITNKSQMLLSYNPVHKQVLILIHQGRPVVESQAILEYIIDENCCLRIHTKRPKSASGLSFLMTRLVDLIQEKLG